MPRFVLGWPGGFTAAATTVVFRHAQGDDVVR